MALWVLLVGFGGGVSTVLDGVFGAGWGDPVGRDSGRVVCYLLLRVFNTAAGV